MKSKQNACVMCPKQSGDGVYQSPNRSESYDSYHHVVRYLLVSLLITLSTVSVARLPLFAQAERAILSGTVTDAVNALVPQATVTLRHPATGFVRETETTDSGIYSISGLPVGSFELSVRKSGFNDAKSSSIVLAVGQRATVDVVLTISTVATIVEVVAEGIQLDKSSAGDRRCHKRA